jgi:hypothetical protein
MDPLSVTMAIVGLLTAADHISSTLQPLIKKAANAPKEIQEMKSSVDGIRTVLSQLKLMLIGKSQVDRNRTFIDSGRTDCHYAFGLCDHLFGP